MNTSLVPFCRLRRALMIAITTLFMLLIFAQLGRADPITDPSSLW